MQSIYTLAHAAMDPSAADADAGAGSPAIKNLFLLLQGSYGSLFLAKFSTGVVDGRGRDLGVRAAMAVWRAQLAKFPDDVIECAAFRVTAEHPKFPPNLPEFEALCRAATTRKTHAELAGYARLPAPQETRLEVPVELMGDGKDWARKIKARVDAGDKSVKRGVLMPALQALGIVS